MSEDLDKERLNEMKWLKAIEGRREKPCPSKKAHKRHIWNGSPPMADGWYCFGLGQSMEPRRKK